LGVYASHLPNDDDASDFPLFLEPAFKRNSRKKGEKSFLGDGENGNLITLFL
jgi:hypothetical protein